LEDADNEDVLPQSTAEDEDLLAPNMAEMPATQQAAGADLPTSLQLRDLAIVNVHAPRIPNDGSLLLPWRAKEPMEVPTYPAVPAEVLPDVTEGGAATMCTIDVKRMEINKAAFYMHACTDDITATTSTIVAPNITPVTAGPETSNRGEQLDVSTARAAAWPAADMSRPNNRHATIYESSERQVELVLRGNTYALQGVSTVRSIFAATATLARMPTSTFRLTSGGRELGCGPPHCV